MLASNTLIKGMSQDRHPKFQDEGTWRYAMNAVVESVEGERLALSNELGNLEWITGYPTGKVIVGNVNLDDDRIVLFFYDPATSSPQHEIGIYDSKSKTYTQSVVGTCLNFSDQFPINAIYKRRRGCEDVIYFTDANNPYRVINLSNIEHSTLAAQNQCDKLNYSRPYNFPCIRPFFTEADESISDDGGLLEVGVYYFSVRYLDREFNPTDWIFVTRGFAVGDEAYALITDEGGVSQYDGGSNNPDSMFYINPTNKTIKLSLSDIDGDFAYVQLAVIKRTGDGGTITGVDVLPPLDIPLINTTFLYKGLNHSVEYTTSVDEILAKRLVIDKVVAHDFFDDRLYVANIQSPKYNWAAFQRSASKIKTEWQREAITSPATTLSKQGGYYMQNASFMANEVYALGVVYIMEDGSESPVFHIPGRAPDVIPNNHSNPLIGNNGVAFDSGDWDTKRPTAYGTIIDSDRDYRWQQVSTATKLNGADLGLLGYWETTTNYPTIENCDAHADGYWGRDWQNNLLTTSTKIRHHRMPGPEITKNTDPSTVSEFRIGLRFSNVSYSEGAVGHRFVYAKRDQEKTIIAKGILFPLYRTYGNRINGLPPFDTIDSVKTGYIVDAQTLAPSKRPHNPPTDNYPSTYVFVTADTLLKDTSFQGTYLSLEKVVYDYQYTLDPTANVIDYSTFSIFDNNGLHTDTEFDGTMFHYVRYIPHTGSALDPYPAINYSISSLNFLPKSSASQVEPNSIYDTTINSLIYNGSINNSYHIITTDNPILENMIDGADMASYPNRLPYVALKTNSDPFSNLFSLRYTPMRNCSETAVSTANAFLHYGGDTFVQNVGFVDFNYKFTQDIDLNLDVDVAYNNYYDHVSTHNFGFRHGAPRNPLFNYFKWNYEYDPAGHEQLLSYIESKFTGSETAPAIAAESYNYNDSYSFMQSLSEYYPLPLKYQICSNCDGEYPYHIYASQIDSKETSDDPNRIIKVNDFTLIEGNTGPITDLFDNFNKLYAATRRSLYYIPTRPQSLVTGEQTVYVGDGGLFSLPPTQLKTTDYAFGGTSSFRHRLNTHYGTFYVDDFTGHVNVLTTQISDIAKDTLSSFFQNEGKIRIKEQYKELTGYEYPVTSPYFGGYQLAYDQRYKRVIIAKKDFEIKPAYATTFERREDILATDGILYYLDIPYEPSNLTSNIYGRKFLMNTGGLPNVIDITNKTYFYDRSFTISYSLLVNGFASFHSYLPHHLFYNSDSYLLASRANVFAGNKGPYQVYEGTKYNHIIDFIASANPREVKVFDNLFFSSITSAYNSTTETFSEVPDRTFDNYIIYTSNQSTGIQSINLHSPFNIYDNNIIRKTDNQWRISDARSLVVDPNLPIWTSEKAFISAYYPIDKVPNPTNIDYAKSDFERERLRDYYFGIRLFFNPDLDYKITTELLSTTFSNRNR